MLAHRRYWKTRIWEENGNRGSMELGIPADRDLFSRGVGVGHEPRCIVDGYVDSSDFENSRIESLELVDWLRRAVVRGSDDQSFSSFRTAISGPLGDLASA